MAMDPHNAATANQSLSESPIQALQQFEEKISSLPNLNQYRITRIYKVSPQKAVELKEELIPSVIGLGFLHGNLDSSFQGTKQKYLKDFLRRDNAKPILNYWTILEEKETDIRNFYFPRPNISKEELLETMLVDAGFILQLFTEYQQYLRERNSSNFYKFIPKHAMKTVRKDLLKYENQIPFKVIQSLWCIGNGAHPDSIIKLKTICMKFFGIEIPSGLELVEYCPAHLLELYYNIHIRRPPTAIAKVDTKAHLQIQDNQKLKTIPSASTLKEYGVKFNRTLRDDNFFVQFEEGKMDLPFLQIDDTKRCVLANLVVYEEEHEGNKPVSALCFVLNSLMRTDQDVVLLSKKGIIENISGNDKSLVDFFSHVCREVEMDSQKEYLSDVVTAINDHFQSQPKRWWATFLREFFIGPWSYVIVGYGLVSAVLNIISFVWQYQEHARRH